MEMHDSLHDNRLRRCLINQRIRESMKIYFTVLLIELSMPCRVKSDRG